MIPSIAWKNVWRNKTRSIIVITAFTLGIFGGLFSVAVMLGMVDSRVQRAIQNEVSHLQVHHSKFQQNNELEYTINQYSELEESITALPEVKAVSPRLKIFAMATTSGNASGVMVNAIDPQKEAEVTNINEFIVEEAGSFFGNKDEKSIVIGQKLARNLKLVYYKITDESLQKFEEEGLDRQHIEKLGKIRGERFRNESDFEDKVRELIGAKVAKKYEYFIVNNSLEYKLHRKIIIQFQSLGGDLAYDAFRVGGIYKTANSAFEAMNVFVKKEDIGGLADLNDNQVHEVAIFLHDNETLKQAQEKIEQLLSADQVVDNWKELMPEIAMQNEMMDFFLYIFMIIILLALGFGIVNTMLMAVLERLKELGMLMAIGMSKKRVFLMIMLETIYLSMTGAILGMLVSVVVISFTGQYGIDLSALYGAGLESMGYSAHLFPSISWVDFVEVTILVLLTGLIASIYPARKALKLNPADALRIE